MDQDLTDVIQTLQTEAIILYYTNKNDELNLKEKKMILKNLHNKEKNLYKKVNLILKNM